MNWMHLLKNNGRSLSEIENLNQFPHHKSCGGKAECAGYLRRCAQAPFTVVKGSVLTIDK
jgi:hypothetical protein